MYPKGMLSGEILEAPASRKAEVCARIALMLIAIRHNVASAADEVAIGAASRHGLELIVAQLVLAEHGLASIRKGERNPRLCRKLSDRGVEDGLLVGLVALVCCHKLPELRLKLLIAAQHLLELAGILVCHAQFFSVVV